MSITLIEQQLIPDVAAAQTGDINAFERLVLRCQRSVSSIALAIVKDLDASEDITQQVFIHIWQQLNTLQNPASFLPWVRQITRYRAFNYLRDNKIAAKVSADEAETLLADFASDSDLAGELEQAQQNQIMANFISQLPADIFFNPLAKSDASNRYVDFGSLRRKTLFSKTDWRIYRRLFGRSAAN